MNSSNPTVARSHSPPPPVSVRIAPAYEKNISRTLSLVTMRFPGGRVETQRLGVGDVPHAPPLSHRTPPPSASRHDISGCSSQLRLSPAVSHHPSRRSTTLHAAELPYQLQPQLPASPFLPAFLVPTDAPCTAKAAAGSVFFQEKESVTSRVGRRENRGEEDHKQGHEPRSQQHSHLRDSPEKTGKPRVAKTCGVTQIVLWKDIEGNLGQTPKRGFCNLINPNLV